MSKSYFFVPKPISGVVINTPPAIIDLAAYFPIFLKEEALIKEPLIACDGTYYSPFFFT
ncbi:hypothetical protein LCGC14_0781100 [marine sediment metagenome]|uniref:Uncharacterized protein n=1 Tax=marine sediment metagenome TaxID=412755 RepID=A0A0F9QFC6_9ZZZZ